MRKQTLYPKTTRVGKVSTRVVITEKLDGSNLSFFKLNGILHIAQRNWIFTLEEAIDGTVESLYKGLAGWLIANGKALEEELQENACICGEWTGMGKLSYGNRFDGIKFMQFAKANVKDSDFNLTNIYYDIELFKWSYKSQELPEFISTVPIVVTLDHLPGTKELDDLYQDCIDPPSGPCEGFVVNINNTITKYVRMKNGKLTEHKS